MDHERNLVSYFYVYILQSVTTEKLYIGYTNDLRKRFNQHVAGESTYTKSRGPWKLIYYEACLNEDDARSREKYLKSGRGRQYINSRLNRFLFCT